MKAAHNGTCQICGALQAAATKNSVLALHGYTTRWGFFSGTCSGSKELPFELSKGLIEASIENATNQAAELDAEARRLRTSDEGTSTWVNHYVPGTGHGRQRVASSYRWMKVEILKVADADRFFWGYQVTDSTGKTDIKRLNAYYSSTPISEIVFKQNVEYSRTLEKRAAELKLYVQWQKARIANWTPSELKPRTEEAKKPTTRTVGARVEMRDGNGGWLQGVVQGSYTQMWVMVSVKFDNGTSRSVRQSWLRLVAEAQQEVA